MRDVVAVDGPAGAGKSTVARRVAKTLGYAFLDTGAMYRATTWWALHQGIDLDDPAALAASTRAMDLDLSEEDGVQRVAVNGQDVTAAIRSPEITRQIHKLDGIPAVRACLVDLQRAFGAKGPTVAEGRDIGTVVFPKAKCKVYMDASLEQRARRRAADLESRGVRVDLDALREEIRVRDEKNMTRKESPLRRADDAILVDTTDLTLDQVVEKVAALAREAL
ncbi:MAG: (d)CMP kinase [Nitrospiraceae bacterium]|nr:(d)CMP kinase [Nitrospiraceae bacterium]